MVLSIIFGINEINLGIMFILAFLSSFGLPGALFFMIFLGIISKTWIEVLLISLTCLFGTVIGDILAYESARKLQFPLHKILKNFTFFKNNEKKIKKELNKERIYTIFFTKFALRSMSAIVNYISGFKRIKRKKFILTIISGEIIYSSLYPWIGFFFKKNWTIIVNLMEELFLLLLLVLIFLILINKRLKK
ncbi:MAG: VTT domain-containing protein [archaeon]